MGGLSILLFAGLIFGLLLIAWLVFNRSSKDED